MPKFQQAGTAAAHAAITAATGDDDPVAAAAMAIVTAAKQAAIMPGATLDTIIQAAESLAGTSAAHTGDSSDAFAMAAVQVRGHTSSLLCYAVTSLEPTQSCLLELYYRSS